MRIAVDGTTLRAGQTSAGRYTELLLRHLACCQDVDVTLIAPTRIETRETLLRTLPAEVPRWRVPYRLWLHAVAPRALRRIGPDVAHFTDGTMPRRAGVPVVVTIHHAPAHPGFVSGDLERVVRTADAVIAPSDAVRARLAQRCGSATRVHVVAPAPAPIFRPIHRAGELELVRRRYQLAERFVLYVGPIQADSRLAALIEGYAVRRRSRDLPLQLVCVGAYRRGLRAIEVLLERHRLDADVRFTGQIPFADMPALYNLAEICVPGCVDGCGLPLLESMACGTPAVVERALVPDDLGLSSVEAVERQDAASLGDALAVLAANRSARQRLAAVALGRVRARSWDRCARETLGVYRTVAATSRPHRGGEQAEPPEHRSVTDTPR